MSTTNSGETKLDLEFRHNLGADLFDPDYGVHAVMGNHSDLTVSSQFEADGRGNSF